tara:strand:+ start:3928 stop:4269 length:342 start_codon:yes stop_codon:yes gene_type:complete
MHKQVYKMILAEAERLAEAFSDPGRARNPNGESFELVKVEVRSETVACGLYRKNTGKYALASFKWVNAGKRDDIGVGDRSFIHSCFVSYSDLRGWQLMLDDLAKVEKANGRHN